MVAVLFSLSGGPAVALDPAKRLTEYDQRSWGERDGLPHTSVFAIAQTADGYLWVGTDSGLARFDGVSFTNFGMATKALVADQIRALYVDRSGNLWIGTKGGSASVRRFDGAFEHFSGRRLGITGNSVLSFLEDSRGALWISGWYNVARGVKEQFTGFDGKDGALSATLWAVREDRGGAFWFGSETGGLLRFQDGRFTMPLSAELAGTNPLTLFVEPQGALWIGTDKGASRYENGVTRRFTKADGLAEERVNVFFRDHDENLWLGTGAGLVRYRQGRFETLSRRDGLVDNAVQALAEDREGNLWMGTMAGGLTRLSDGKFTNIGTAEGLSTDRTTAAYQGRDGALWIGTSGGGVARHQSGVLRLYTISDGLCVNWVSALHEDREGGLWVGGSGNAANLCRLRDGRWRSFGLAEGFRSAHTVVRVVLQDSRGVTWFGSDRLYRLAGDRVVLETFPETAEPSPQNIFAMAEDRRGDLWLGTATALWQRAGGVWRKYSGLPGMSGDLMLSIHEDADGTKWFGSLRGLIRLRKGVFTSFRQKQGLFEDSVCQVLADDDGHLWLSSPRGVFRVDRTDIEDYDRGLKSSLAPTRFGLADGMKAVGCGSEANPAGTRTRDGKLWFATSRGLAGIDPRDLKTNRQPPPVWIERLIVDGRAIGTRDRNEIPPGRRQVEIGYTALSFTAPEKVRFRYRLEPFDHEWLETSGGQRTAHYTNIPPGAYRFRVIAANNDGVWNEAGAALDLRVAPYFRETLVFRLLLALGVLLAAWAVHRWRLGQVKARHGAVLAERARMAREIHDTLAQGFSGISLHLEAATQSLANAPESARKNLDQARSLARQSLTEARRAVWGLRSQALEGSDLVAAVSALTSRLGGQPPARLAVHGVVKPLTPAHEEALLKVAQEALANAVKHARASQIAVVLDYGADAVELRIADNGVGFEATTDFAARGHFGLQGIRERVLALGGTLGAHGAPGKGTEIVVRLPIAPSDRR